MRSIVSRLFAMLAIGVVPLNGACGSTGEDADATGAALTVDDERFVVAASPERVVLRKTIDDVDLPWGAAQLKGKALVIFPIAGITDEGVYARANDVADDGAVYTIQTTPLGLEEMETIREQDVLLVKRPPAQPLVTGGDAEPRDLHVLAAGAASGAAGAGPPIAVFPSFNVSVGTKLFGVPIAGGAGVTHTVKTASLEPQVLAEWSKDAGLEVGIKGSLRWDSTLTISVRNLSTTELYRSEALETPPLVLPVLIGPAAVPVALTGRAFVTCSSTVGASLDLSVHVTLTAQMSASMRVAPRADVAVADWIGPGRWPNAASGSAKATVKGPSGVGVATIICGVPALELRAKLGGVAGPYVGVAPTAVLGPSGASMETRVTAGVEAGVLGATASAAVTLLTIKN